jgi:hypothetical protein
MKSDENHKIMDKKMKYLLTLSLFSILFFLGCDQETDITSPLSESLDLQQKVTSVLPVTDDTNTLSDDPNGRDPYLQREDYPPGADDIFIPINLPPSVIPNLEASEVIDGQSGGFIEIYFEYHGGGDDDDDDDDGGSKIILYARLDILPKAFEGSEEISMILNNEIGTISFYPHMVFKRPVHLDVMYSGIDLSGINPNSVDFIFQNYDGTTEQVEFDSIEMDESTGTIELDDAELTHFSRYGFVN